MGRLICIEGLDGSGKNTLCTRLAATVAADGGRLARIAFPRYGTSVFAGLIQDGLYGRLGDLTESVYGMALLFALDRRDAAAQIRSALAANDIVLLDRYVSSNAAYGAARLGAPDVPSDFPRWVRDLELERFGVPAPDLQILLATPPALAAERASSRAAGDSSRALDTFESDAGLQRRTGAVYAQLAAQSFLSPWQVLAPDADGVLPVPDLTVGAVG